MTANENKATTARANRAFKFYVNGTEFFPGEGTRLHFANQAMDTLSLVNIPHGLLTASDEVTVKYNDTCVFRGTVAQIIDKHSRGDTRVNDVTCQGPWGKMQRLVFRQAWNLPSNNNQITIKSGRVILNQSPIGESYTQSEQLKEILEYAPAKCGYSYEAGNIIGKDICLPLDETRDVTVAAAIQRELRFFPKTIVRFDYSADTPTIHISEPSSSGEASYIASIPKTARQYEYNAHPISGVYLYLSEQTFEVNGETVVESAQKYPDSADPEDLDCLVAYIPLAPSASSTSWAKFHSQSEVIGSISGSNFWRMRHPRLKDIPLASIEITEAERSSTAYDYIAQSTTEDLAAAGLHSEICRFSCKAKITTDDDIEEEILLTMDYLTTDAKPDTDYTWQTGSSFTAGETLPEGLAQAIYEQRSASLKNETMTIRLGDKFPVLGDMCDGLYLQDFDVDCTSQTASLHFGQPEYLSIDDMRGLLSGFRSRGYAANSPARMGGEDSGEDDGSDATGKCIQPLSSTEFCPGTKSKTTFKSISNTSHGNIILDSSKVTSKDKNIEVHTLKYKSSDSETSRTGVQLLSSKDVTLNNITSIEGDESIEASMPDENGKVTLRFTGETPENPDGSSGKTTSVSTSGTGITVTPTETENNTDYKLGFAGEDQSTALAVKTLTITKSEEEGGDEEYKILASGDIEISPGGDGIVLKPGSGIKITDGSGTLVTDSTEGKTGPFTLQAVYIE